MRPSRAAVMAARAGLLLASIAWLTWAVQAAAHLTPQVLLTWLAFALVAFHIPTVMLAWGLMPRLLRIICRKVRPPCRSRPLKSSSSSSA